MTKLKINITIFYTLLLGSASLCGLTTQRVITEKIGAFTAGSALATAFIFEKLSPQSSVVCGALGASAYLYTAYRDYKQGALDARRVANHAANVGLFFIGFFIPCIVDAHREFRASGQPNNDFVKVREGVKVHNSLIADYQKERTIEKNH
jgi:hypothetical protein